MRKENAIFKRTLFILMIGCLFVPLIQSKFNLIETQPLKGAFEEVKKPKLTYSTWFEGNYQTEIEKYVNQNYGFRNDIVRLYNQIQFSFFNKVSTQDVIVGKENYLFEEDYILTYLGRDYVGSKIIDEQIFKLQKVNDTLQKLGLKVLLVFAPGKAAYFPEFIPDNYQPWKKSISNYSEFSAKLRKTDLEFIDFQKWFLENKKTTKYPLYPKTGIHWSVYGSYLATDSMISRISSLVKYETPDFVIDKIELRNELGESDEDIETAMNLMFDIPDIKPMAYPTYHKKGSGKAKSPKVMVVADSYWSVFSWALMDDFFGGGKFWFYGTQINTLGSSEIKDISQVNLKEEVEKNEILLILQTDSNSKNLGFSIVDKLYNIYYPSK